MIRTGSSSFGVSTTFNSFHSASAVTSGFYTNVIVPGPPPPTTLSKVFGTSGTSAPYFRNGGTIYADVYQLPDPPTTVQNLYFTITTKSFSTTKISWNNNYSGECLSLLPEGLVSENLPGDVDISVYLRINNRAKPVKILSAYYTAPNISGHDYYAVLVLGPDATAQLPAPGASGIDCSFLLGKESGRFTYSVTEPPLYPARELTKNERKFTDPLWPTDGCSLSKFVFEERPLNFNWDGHGLDYIQIHLFK